MTVNQVRSAVKKLKAELEGKPDTPAKEVYEMIDRLRVDH
jgi:hypothetical protein